MSSPLEAAAYLMNRATRLLTRRAEKRLAQIGLAVAQMPVLRALRAGKALCQKDLATLAEVEQPAMAELLRRMERDGYLLRSPDPNDRRSSLFELTTAAKDKVEPARNAFVLGHREALAGFTKEEVAAFTAFLSRVVINLEA